MTTRSSSTLIPKGEFFFKLKKKKNCEKSLPALGIEPGPTWWQTVTLTTRLTGPKSEGPL